jgi:single-strand DNA-binding protein
MPNLNEVRLMGNITRDIELKYTPKGTAVAAFGLAINRSWKDDSGTKHEETTFVDVEMFGRMAEIVGEYCKKGSPIYIGGRLKMDQWEDKTTGQKRSRLKIIGETLQLLGGKPQSSEGTSRRTEAPAEQPKPRPMPTSDYDDSVPF